MTSNRTNYSDPLFEHVVSVIPSDMTSIRARLSGRGITNYGWNRDLVDLMKDHNKINSIKWRNCSIHADLPAVHMNEQLKFSPSFLNYLPELLYKTMDPEHHNFWMSIPAKCHEMILTSRPVSEEHQPPGTFLAGRHARATNQAEGECQANVTGTTIVNAMMDNSLHSRDSFDSRKRLMSTQNKSSEKLVPFNHPNLIPANHKRNPTCLQVIVKKYGEQIRREYGEQIMSFEMNRPIGEYQIGMCSVPVLG